MKKDNINEKPEEGVKKKPAFKFTWAVSKRGMYTVAASAIVIVIVLLINLALGSLPAGTLDFDISGKDLYTVSEKSTDYLKTLNHDVQIVVLDQQSAVDKHLLAFLNSYVKQSAHLSLKFVDPVIDPTALTTYKAKQDNVVVLCKDTNRTKILNVKGIEGLQDGLIEGDYNTYAQSNQFKASSLDAEGQLTSAVSYVTSAATSKIYTLSGHGESALGTNASDRISKANVSIGTLNLLQEAAIPKDCELLLCVNPTADLSDSELSALKTYLGGGGHVMILLDNPALKNFNALLKVYGLQMENGYVGDNDRYVQSLASTYGKYCIYPILSTTSDVTSSISLDAVLIGARGMTQVTAEHRSAQITPFMTTSDKAFDATDNKTSKAGTYIIGATATESVSTGTETASSASETQSRLTVITAVSLIDDNLTSSFPNTANLDIFFNAVSKNLKTADLISIPAKSLAPTYNTPANPLLWFALFVIIIPVAIIVTGVVNWSKRRRR